MEMQELEITIDQDGTVKIAVHGGTRGEDCLSLTRSIENAVGSVEERTYLPEYYQESVGLERNRSVTR